MKLIAPLLSGGPATYLLLFMEVVGVRIPLGDKTKAHVENILL